MPSINIDITQEELKVLVLDYSKRTRDIENSFLDCDRLTPTDFKQLRDLLVSLKDRHEFLLYLRQEGCD